MIDEKMVIAKLEQCRNNFDDLLSTKRIGEYNVTKYVKREHMNRFLTTLIEYVNGLKEEKKTIKFVLDGCDISFVAEAPSDITLEQLLKQCDRIKPDWCACGIRSFDKVIDYDEVEIVIGYDDIRKVSDDVSCRIKEE